MLKFLTSPNCTNRITIRAYLLHIFNSPDGVQSLFSKRNSSPTTTVVVYFFFFSTNIRNRYNLIIILKSTKTLCEITRCARIYIRDYKDCAIRVLSRKFDYISSIFFSLIETIINKKKKNAFECKEYDYTSSKYKYLAVFYQLFHPE